MTCKSLEEFEMQYSANAHKQNNCKSADQTSALKLSNLDGIDYNTFKYLLLSTELLVVKYHQKYFCSKLVFLDSSLLFKSQIHK